MPIDPEKLEATSPNGARYPVRGVNLGPMALMGVEVAGTDATRITSDNVVGDLGDRVDLAIRLQPGPLEIGAALHHPMSFRTKEFIRGFGS